MASAADRQRVQGSRPAVVADLTPTGSLAKGTRLQLAIGLPVRNPVELSSLLRQIYDPASPEYHHYLTPEQFTERFGPTEADYQSVVAFARAHGLQVTATHPNRLLLDVSGTVPTVESALHVTLHTYRHPTENRTFFAPDTAPSLDLATPILRISGLDDYSRPRAHFKTMPLGRRTTASPNAGSGPGGTYQGNDFRTAYVPGCTLTGAGQVVGLLQFDGYNPADITHYESGAGLPNVPLQNVLLDGFDGNPTYTGGEVEVSIDIEMVVSMAPGLSKVLVYEAGPNGDWHDLLNRMATDNLAQQLSCSWYMHDGPADSLADQIWQEMAVQGQTFFGASGDNDAWPALISFPDDSPYITLVGGTTLATANGAWVSETVWNWSNGQGSGGGISTQYPIPSWQTNLSMAANQGSTTQRNTPDVALTADYIHVWADGTDHENLGGTSFAAPLWAGFAALVNQQAAAFGQPALGFLNPALDRIGSGTNYAAGFHDITTGNNESPASPTQFLAAPGYDLCTGWGTPAGQPLIDALAFPEPLVITPSTGLVSSGRVGGPFFPAAQSFSLTNVGTNSLTWSLVNTSAWLTVSSSGGTLAPGEPAGTVTVGWSANADDLAAGTYLATLWFTNLDDQVGRNRQFSLTVINPPAILTQPVGQAVIEGESAAFTVAASGGLPLSYQWQENGTHLTDGSNVSGSATANLVINTVLASALGSYTVVVTNSVGAVTSSNAVLSLAPSRPIITGQPAHQITVAGETAVFTVAAVGSQPFACQWMLNGTNLPGATNITLTLADVQPIQAGGYQVGLTNDYGWAVSSNATLSVYTVPLITSVSPGAGPAGTQVNLAGVNFNPDAGGNIVCFGAVSAAVTAANPTNLTVSVPAGATFAPVTETTGGQTAAAAMAFLPDFIGSGEFTNSSLGGLLDLPTGNEPGPVVIADLDGDGRPDLIVTTGDHTIYIYQNIGTNGVLSVNSFAPPVILPLGNGSFGALQAADLTGDGKLDLVTVDSQNNVVIVLKNLSAPGTLTTNSFGPPVTFPCGAGATGVAVGDIDGDGKPEMVTADFGSNSVSVLLNLSTPGVIAADSFAPAMDFTVGSNPNAVAIADLDGDGKPDVVTVNNGDTGAMTVLRNLSTPGNLVFAPNVVFQGVAGASAIAVGDLDGDGKADVVVGAQSSELVSVFRNTSTPGSITTNSFAPHVDFAAGGWVNSLAIGDLDGDGKPDLVAVVQQPSQMEVFLNTSTPGSLTSNSLSAPVVFGSDNDGSNPGGVAVGDLDGDGRPEIVFPNVYSGNVSLYPNVMPFGGPPAIILQPASQTVVSGCPVTFSVAVTGVSPLSCQWSLNGTNLAGATNPTLGLTNVQLSQAGNYAVVITNLAGSVTSSVASLVVLDLPTIIDQPTNQSVLAGSTATFAVMASGTAPLAYQWLENGSPLTDGGAISGSATSVLTLTEVGPADAADYSVDITNLAGSETSQSARLTVDSPPAIVSQPAGVTNDAGRPAFFAVTANGTAPLSYQWVFNGTNLAGATNATLTLFNLQTVQAGAYSVWVTNQYGVILSSNAVLRVDSPPPHVPFIMTFRPPMGSTGAVVNIAGANFSPAAASNTVFFGAVQAVVTAASATHLTVLVPAGATFAPITETVPGLTAASGPPFLPVFLGAGMFVNSALAGRVDLPSGDGPYSTVIADLDGDGRPDLAVTTGDQNIYLYENLSTNHTITADSFAPPVVLPLGAGSYGTLVAADLTGDGKLDLVTVDSQNNVVVVLKNLGSPGSLTTNSFGPPVTFPCGESPTGVAVGDLDGDGQPELVTANAGDTTISVLLNLSTPGEITTNSFAAAADFNAGPNPENVIIADVDGDGQPEVLTVNNGGTDALSVLRNISLPGSIAFETAVVFPGLPGSDSIAVGDLDGDGQPDVVIGTQDSQAISVFRNTCVPGTITTNSFAPRVDFAVDGWVNGVVLGDLSGDGKPDVVAVGQMPDQLLVFQNLSTPGGFTSNSLAAPVVFATGSDPNTVAMGDLDGDGRPDLVFANGDSGTVSVDQNSMPFGGPPAIILQPAGQTVVAGSPAVFNVMADGWPTLGYQWSCNGTNLAGATNATLLLTNVLLNQAGNYAVWVTNQAGLLVSSNAVLVVNPWLQLAWAQIPSPRFVNTPFAVVVQAQTFTNGIATNFTGTVTLLSTNGVPLVPEASANFIQGVWTGAVTVAETVTNLVLQASDSLGDSGLANPINVVALPTLTASTSDRNLLVAWPLDPPGFNLETSPWLFPADWIPVTNPPAPVQDQNVLSLPLSGTNAFYRLSFPGP